MENKKLSVIGIGIIVIITIFVFVVVFNKKQSLNNLGESITPIKQIEPINSVARDNQAIDQTVIEETQPTVAPEPIQQDLRGLKYQNKEYGFEFSFDQRYKNFSLGIEIYNKDYNDYFDDGVHNFSGLVVSYMFLIKNAFVPALFDVSVYEKEWFNDNATILSDGESRRKGKEKEWEMGDVFGDYLGENDKYVFTVFPNYMCADNEENINSSLCKMTMPEEKTKMVLKSFKILK